VTAGAVPASQPTGPAWGRLLLLLALLAGMAAPLRAAHITDKLLAGLYDKPGADKPLRLLQSGTPLDVLEKKGDHAKVRLGDGTIGWVEQRYLTDEKPARALLLEVQAETARLRDELRQAQSGAQSGAGAQGAAPAAADRELADLRRQLAAAQTELDRLRQATPATATGVQDQELERLRQDNRLLRERIAQAADILALPPPEAGPSPSFQPRLWHLGMLTLMLVAGFVAGVLFRNHRLRQRYSGLRF
jgi:SH3 domain protein